MRTPPARHLLPALLALALSAPVPGLPGIQSASAGEFSIVARDGEPVPGVPGHVLNFAPATGANRPVIDETGAIYFTCGWGGQGDGALFVDVGTGPSIFLRNATPIDGIPLEVGRFHEFSVSPQGAAAGIALNFNIEGVPNTRAILHTDGTTATLVHEDEQPAPVGPGTARVGSGFDPSIDARGRIFYAVTLDGTPGGTSDDAAMFRFDPADSSFHLVVTEGDTIPSGTGLIEPIGSTFEPPKLNASGEAAFLGRLPVQYDRARGIFVDHVGAMREVAVEGLPLGNGGTVEGLRWGPNLNAWGHVAFRASLDTGSSSTPGIYIHRGSEVKGRLAGSPAPDMDGDPFGVFSGFTWVLRLNDRSEVVFQAWTTEGKGLFLFDGDEVRALARTGLPAPGGGMYETGGALSGGNQMQGRDNPFVTNAAGQVLFQAYSGTDTTAAVRGLYLYDPPPASSVQRILAVGDTVDGFEITSMDGSYFDRGYTGAGALNNSGEIALRVGTSGGPAILRYDSDVTSVGSDPDPGAIQVLRNAPNPFRQATTISYRTERSGPVSVEVFDIRGRRIRTLVSGSRPAGEHRVRWDGLDDAGRPAGAGVYFYRLLGPGMKESRRMTLVR